MGPNPTKITTKQGHKRTMPFGWVEENNSKHTIQPLPQVASEGDGYLASKE